MTRGVDIPQASTAIFRPHPIINYVLHYFRDMLYFIFKCIIRCFVLMIPDFDIRFV